MQTLVEFSDLVARAEIVQDDTEPRDRYQPTRKEISDALIAGEWFAKLALLPENVDEYERLTDVRRRSDRRVSTYVEEQKVIAWWAFGMSLRLIGEGLRVNEFEAERRLNQAAISLWRIANGWAEFADVEARSRARKRYAARIPGRGAARGDRRSLGAG